MSARALIAFAVFIAIGSAIMFVLISTGALDPALTEEEIQLSVAYAPEKTVPEPAPSFSPEPIPSVAPVAEAADESDPASVVLLSEYATLIPGDDNQSVLLLQDRLVELGYMESDEPTTVYNDSVKAAIMRFQRTHGLEMTGIADAELQALLFSEAALPYRIQSGDSGDDVAAAQLRLAELGFYSGRSTGYYGPLTEEAVRLFEYQNGLPVDGILDVTDWRRLYSNQAGHNISTGQAASSYTQESALPASDVSYAHSADGLAHAASDQMEKPYVWGKEGPDAFDNSGLIRYCLHLCGISVGKTESASLAETEGWPLIVKTSLLKKGDLLFFKSDVGTSITHVGIAVGPTYFVHASSSSGKVVTSSLSEPYWSRNFVFARRIFNG